MTLGDLLTDHARRRPQAVALIDERAGHPTRTLTYAQLEDEVAGAAAWLAAQGLRRGSAVLTFVPMSADLYVALLALFRLGAVALFLDPSAGREHLERCCARWTPDALLAIPKAHLLRLRSSALRRIPLKLHTGRGWIPGARRWLSGGKPAIAAANVAGPEDPALVTFTSGSTGVPKGAVRTQAFLLAQFHALAPNITLEPGEVDLATLPVFTLANLAAGVTTVIPAVDLKRPGEVEAAPLFEQIKRRQVTRITASPAFFERLIAHGRATGERLPTLRKLYTGGAPVYPRLLDALRTWAPEAHTVAVYGSTEAEPIAHLEREEITPDDLAAMRAGQGLLAGAVVPQIKLAILRDQWGTPREPMTQHQLEAERRLPQLPGEIVVNGDHVLAGYLGGIGDAETKFSVDGKIWHRTGDAGLLDERGRLWLLGRCAARIEDAHGVLYPFGVECVAMTYPTVRRAAVLSYAGRRLLVIEATEPGPKLEATLLAATEWAHLDEVMFLERIPVDPRHNAKIDYPALRRLLEHR
ncbi:MAG TPA: AMP-binding protein [Candidatus Synoicihabitans sp.]|nr:AMP-binding protein [Candidatus Synoicihabitans sp.]